MPPLTELHFTDDTYQGDMLQRLLEMVALQIACANCAEIVAATGTLEDAIECNLPTLKQCAVKNCELPICDKHSKLCRNCGLLFCYVCYQSHIC